MDGWIDSEPVCHVRAFLNLVRSMRSTTFNAFTFSEIFYPPRDAFLTAGARAYQKHVLHGPETVSIFIQLLAVIFSL